MAWTGNVRPKAAKSKPCERSIQRRKGVRDLEVWNIPARNFASNHSSFCSGGDEQRLREFNKLDEKGKRSPLAHSAAQFSFEQGVKVIMFL
ncbi:unnamed protein product [Victoria cruziana]